MNANETDPATGTRSTRPQASAEAANDTPTGNPSQPRPTLPPTVRARVSVEVGVPMGWREFVGDAGRTVGLNHFGASAAYTVLYEQFGLTADGVVAAARESLAAAGVPPTAPTGPDSAGVLRTPTGDR
jgi:transketolase